MFFSKGEIHFSSIPFLKKSEKLSLSNPYSSFPSNPVDISNQDKNNLHSIRELVQTGNKSKLQRPEMAFQYDEIAEEKISAYDNKLGIIGIQTDGSQCRNNARIYVRSTRHLECGWTVPSYLARYNLRDVFRSGVFSWVILSFFFFFEFVFDIFNHCLWSLPKNMKSMIQLIAFIWTQFSWLLKTGFSLFSLAVMGSDVSKYFRTNIK